MRKIRADLVGVVMAGGHLLAAGQDVPEGVDVHESLVEGGSEAAKSKKAPGSNEKGSGTSESTGAASDAGDGKEDTAEDYSDLLGDTEETKSSAKAPARGGRKSASTKRS